MPNGKQKLVMVPGTGVVAFPGDMEDEHVAAAIRAFRSQKAADQAAQSHPLNRPQPLVTEESERQRQTKQAQPLSSSIPHLPAWLNTPSSELGRQAGNWLSGEIGKALGTTLPDIDPTLSAERTAERFRQAHPIAGGVAHGISDIANSLTSPAGAALLMTAPESRLMSALFATQALHGAYKDAQSARQAYEQGNNEEATRYATESILGGAMGLAAGAHAVRPELGPQGEVLPPEAKPGPEFPALGSPTPATLEGKTGSFALPEYDEAPIANYQLIYKSPSATPEEMNAAVQDLVKARQAPGWNDPNATEEEARAAQRDFYDAADRLGRLKQQSVGQIRQLPSGEKIVYLTDAGLQDLSAGLRGRAPDPEYSLNGVSISGRYIPIVQQNLGVLQTPHSEELTKLLSMGAGPDGTVTVSAIPNKNETLSNALSRLREELNHGWQKQFSDQMGNHLPSTEFKNLNRSIPDQMSGYLHQHGYPEDSGDKEANRMRVLEASAKMMSGAPSEFGLTPDQAANYLFQYFDAVTRQHGPRALDQLVHTTTLARNIKRDYANARYPSRGSQGQGTLPGLPAGGQGSPQESFGAPGRGTAPVTGPPAQAGAATPSVEASRAAIEKTPDDARRRLQQARESYSALDPESVRRYEEALRDYELSTRTGMNRYLSGQMGQIRKPGDVSDIEELERINGIPSPESPSTSLAALRDEAALRRPSPVPGQTANLSYRAADESQPFYLKSDQIIDQKMKGPMNGPQVLQMLRNNGVKEDELEATGLADLLSEDRKFPPEEVKEFAEANPIQIEEISTGANPPTRWKPEDIWVRRVGDAWIGRAPDLSERVLRSDVPEERAKDELAQLLSRDYETVGKTKYGQYTEPGGENYREILMKFPSGAKGPAQAAYDEFVRKMQRKYFNEGQWAQKISNSEEAERQRLSAAVRNEREGETAYRSPHWNEPNVLVHFRVNDRTLPNGKKVLHVEEVQSDWHQKGRKLGYAHMRVPAEAKRYDGYWEVFDQDGKFITNVQDWQHPDVKTAGEALQVARQRLETEPERVRSTEAVPDAPFKKTWHELALRRILKYAVDHGYEGVSWTPGDKQAGRYDLSKKVDRIAVIPQKSGARAVRIEPKAGTSIKLMVDKDGIVTPAFSYDDQFDGKNIADVVGKEVADKIMGAEGETTLRAPDLVVGGAGMRGFYDKIVPDYLNKIGKKFGAKVGTAATNLQALAKPVYRYEGPELTPEGIKALYNEIKEGKRPDPELAAGTNFVNRSKLSSTLSYIYAEMKDHGLSYNDAVSKTLANSQPLIENFAKEMGGEAVQKTHQTVKFPFLPITPAMRSEMAEPGPLFNQTRKPSIEASKAAITKPRAVPGQTANLSPEPESLLDKRKAALNDSLNASNAYGQSFRSIYGEEDWEEKSEAERAEAIDQDYDEAEREQDEEERRKEADEEYDRQLDARVGYMDGKQAEVEALLKLAGIPYEAKGGSTYSRYLSVELPNGESATIRVSDHEPPVGRGGMKEGALDYHDESEVSLHPGSDSLTKVEQFLREKGVKVAEPGPLFNQTRRTPESSPSTLSDLMEEAKRRAPVPTVPQSMEDMVGRRINTANAEDQDLSRAAHIENGEIVSYHLTDHPERVQDYLESGKPLHEGGRAAEHDELGPGLYASDVPNYWMGRSTGKYAFLNNLTPEQADKLAEAVQNRIDNAGPGYLSKSEVETAHRYIDQFRKDHHGDTLVLLAGQPYNVDFWKPDFLKSIGIEPSKQPEAVEVRAKGNFAEVKNYLRPAEWKALKDAGFDGAWVRAGFSTEPQLVIWNRNAIRKFGDWKPSSKATETPAFKNWFKDSKVVDENGQPLVMYHGSPKTFTEFKDMPRQQGHVASLGEGHYFTSDRQTAENFVHGKKGPSKTSKLYEVYISAKSPFSVATADADRLVEAIKKVRAEDGREPLPQRVLDSYARDVEEIKADSAQNIPLHNEFTGLDKLMSLFPKRVLQEAGYDAIAFHGNGKTKPFNEIVVFDPKQVKSATENRGTFDPTNPDITMNQTRREKEPLLPYDDLVKERGSARSLVAPHTRSDEEFLRSQFIKPPASAKAQRELADKVGRERYDKAVEQFNALPETFTVYRAIEPAEGTEVDRSNLGRYWTTEQSAAKPYHGPSRGTRAGIVLRGTVRKDQVDAKQTIIARMRTGEAALEKEINLKSGETPSDVSVVSPEAPDVTMNQVRATKETAEPQVQALMAEALRRRPSQPTLSEVEKDIADRAPAVVP